MRRDLECTLRRDSKIARSDWALWDGRARVRRYNFAILRGEKQFCNWSSDFFSTSNSPSDFFDFRYWSYWLEMRNVCSIRSQVHARALSRAPCALHNLASTISQAKALVAHEIPPCVPRSTVCALPQRLERLCLECISVWSQRQTLHASRGCGARVSALVCGQCIQMEDPVCLASCSLEYHKGIIRLKKKQPPNASHATRVEVFIFLTYLVTNVIIRIHKYSFKKWINHTFSVWYGTRNSVRTP